MNDPWERLVATGAVQTSVDISSLTTYKLGGPADYFFEATELGSLDLIAKALAERQLPVLVLGRGSNVVISDSGFGGLVLRLGKAFAEIEVGATVVAGGAAGLPQVARSATGAGRRGLEFMIGVPGSVGGGVRQNAGCFGKEMVDVVESVEIFDLSRAQLVRIPAADLDLAYRHSNVSASQIVIEARFATVEGDPAEGLAILREITRWRRLHQPGGTLNAGSVFKNPAGDSAGRIIDSLGLKGTTVGGASVSEKHANFFVAKPGTKALEVYLLTRRVADMVRAKIGIVLEPEIQFVGHFGDEGRV